MKKNILCAGFGGQGILLMGKVLAQSAMKEGNHVTYLPSYGPEMRGGTANCSLVISDAEIASPVIDEYDTLVVMNQPSYDKFVSRVKAGGVVFVNTSLVENYEQPENIRCFTHAFSDDAGKLGNVRVCSMVALGRLIGETKIVSFTTAIEQMKELTEKRPELHEINAAALQTGYAAAGAKI
jgi:2-oxoglutarate ferredoxin oxidoreductase subunit gamma